MNQLLHEKNLDCSTFSLLLGQVGRTMNGMAKQQKGMQGKERVWRRKLLDQDEDRETDTDLCLTQLQSGSSRPRHSVSFVVSSSILHSPGVARMLAYCFIQDPHPQYLITLNSRTLSSPVTIPEMTSDHPARPLSRIHPLTSPLSSAINPIFTMLDSEQGPVPFPLGLLLLLPQFRIKICFYSNFLL